MPCVQSLLEGNSQDPACSADNTIPPSEQDLWNPSSCIPTSIPSRSSTLAELAGHNSIGNVLIGPAYGGLIAIQQISYAEGTAHLPCSNEQCYQHEIRAKSLRPQRTRSRANKGKDTQSDNVREMAAEGLGVLGRL